MSQISDLANSPDMGEKCAALTAVAGRCHDLLKEIHSLTEKINSKYALPTGKFISEALEQLENTAQNFQDKPCKVGVIGEFSCGKSTFINGFTEEHLLVDDILQGTTFVPTILEFSEEEFLSIRKTDGETTSFKNCSPLELRNLLKKFATEDTDVSDIEEITWHTPLPVLSRGFCLMDTPGFGSLRQNHTEAARKAAKSCDVILVLCNLSASPLSQTLLAEVERIAGKDAKNCVFIGTFADKFSKDQLKSLDKYFTKKLASTFGHVPPFFLVSAYKALEQAENNDASPKEWLGEFENFREEILAHIRQINFANKICKTSGILFGILEKTRHNLAEAIDFYVREGKKYSDPDILANSNEFRIATEKLRNDFTNNCLQIRNNCEGSLNRELEKLRARIIRRIKEFKDVDRLKKYMAEGINKAFDKFALDFQDLLQREMIIPMRESAADNAKKYLSRFMPCDARENLPKPENNDLPADLAWTDFRDAGINDLGARHEEDKKLKLGGGFGAGLALAMLVPGAGWLAGGMLALGGMLMGALFMPDIKELKKDCINKLAPVFSRLQDDAMLVLGANYGKTCRYLLDRLEPGSLAASLAERYSDSSKAQARELENFALALQHRFRLLNELAINLKNI